MVAFIGTIDCKCRDFAMKKSLHARISTNAEKDRYAASSSMRDVSYVTKLMKTTKVFRLFTAVSSNI